MLTDIALQSLKPTGKQYIVWDLPNLGIRVSQAGTKTFIAQVGRNRRKLTIGRYPDLSLKEARRKFALLETTPSHVLSNVLDTYISTHIAHYKGTNKRDTEHLLRLYLQPLATRRASSLTSKDITAIMSPLTPSMHNHMFGVFRTFFRWAERHDYIAASPIAKLIKPFKETSRSRTLTNDEIRRIWHACEGTFGDIVKACLLTAQRRGEIACVRPEWLSTTALCIPAHVAKNGREHSIPLTPCAEGLLRKLSASSKPYNAWSKPKKRLDTSSSTSGWTLHDLRRTAATRMAELSVQPHIIERILNHSSGEISGVAAIYNRAKYFEEMREALLRYEAHILSIVAPEA